MSLRLCVFLALALSSLSLLVRADDAEDHRITELLQQASNNPADSAVVFQLAEAYNAKGDWQRAFDYYKQRAHMEGAAQESFYAQFMTAELMHKLEFPWQQSYDAYMRAHEMAKHRMEPLWSIARYYLYESGDHSLAFGFASSAADLPVPPASDIHTNIEAYEYKVWDDLAVAAYYLNSIEGFQQTIRICEDLLTGPKAQKYPHLVEMNRERLQKNLNAAQSELDRLTREADAKRQEHIQNQEGEREREQQRQREQHEREQQQRSDSQRRYAQEEGERQQRDREQQSGPPTPVNDGSKGAQVGNSKGGVKPDPESSMTQLLLIVIGVGVLFVVLFLVMNAGGHKHKDV